MARINNLTAFVTDIATAIKTKKGDGTRIAAADFDTEILALPTGTDTSDADAAANDIMFGRAAYVKGERIIGKLKNYSQVPTSKNTDTEVWDTSSNIMIQSKIPGNIGRCIIEPEADIVLYADKAQVAEAFNIDPEVIKIGVNILGVTGTFTSDADATANDIISGKTAYVRGGKIIGTRQPGTDTSDADAAANDIMFGRTAYVKGEKITGSLFPFNWIGSSSEPTVNYDSHSNMLDFTGTTNNERRIIEPKSKIQLYVDGLEVATAIDLIADKIVTGNTILGIEGTGGPPINKEEYKIAVNTTSYILGEKPVITDTGYVDIYVYDENGNPITMSELTGVSLMDMGGNFYNDIGMKGGDTAIIFNNTPIPIGYYTVVLYTDNYYTVNTYDILVNSNVRNKFQATLYARNN